MTDDRQADVVRIRELADIARESVKRFDELHRGRGWLSDAEKLERAKQEGRASAFDAAADIVDGVVV